MADHALQISTDEDNATVKPLWGAVFAVAIAVFGLITAEFLPASLLPPIAQDLHITEGVAGQAITATAIVGLLASLFVPAATQKIDRRWVLISFSILQIVSNVIVAFAPNFAILIVARFLLGIGLGGFWAMAAATAMRLVPEKFVPRALSIIFGAVSVATVAAAPLGSFLGHLVGWRNVFLLTSVIGLLSLAWQCITLPPMISNSQTRLITLVHVLKRPNIKSGMLAVLLLFCGNSAFFTYLRAFLETVPGMTVNLMTAILLGYGGANFIGTALTRYVFARNFKASMFLLPLVMGVIVTCLVVLGKFPVPAAIIIALWGLLFGPVPVGWSTWLTRVVPDETESGGGLLIAFINLAITIGAATGGILYDHYGSSGVFISSALFMIAAAFVSRHTFRTYNDKLSA